jgi:uncharacterized protein YlzI (FlbEa/FlbD family)
LGCCLRGREGLDKTILTLWEIQQWRKLDKIRKLPYNAHTHAIFIFFFGKEMPNDYQEKAMPRFIKLKLYGGGRVLINIEKIDTIEDEGDRTKIAINERYLYVKESEESIIHKICYESRPSIVK